MPLAIATRSKDRNNSGCETTDVITEQRDRFRRIAMSFHRTTSINKREDCENEKVTQLICLQTKHQIWLIFFKFGNTYEKLLHQYLLVKSS